MLKLSNRGESLNHYHIIESVKITVAESEPLLTFPECLYLLQTSLPYQKYNS